MALHLDQEARLVKDAFEMVEEGSIAMEGMFELLQEQKKLIKEYKTG